MMIFCDGPLVTALLPEPAVALGCSVFSLELTLSSLLIAAVTLSEDASIGSTEEILLSVGLKLQRKGCIFSMKFLNN